MPSELDSVSLPVAFTSYLDVREIVLYQRISKFFQG